MKHGSTRMTIQKHRKMDKDTSEPRSNQWYKHRLVQLQNLCTFKRKQHRVSLSIANKWGSGRPTVRCANSLTGRLSFQFPSNIPRARPLTNSSPWINRKKGKSLQPTTRRCSENLNDEHLRLYNYNNDHNNYWHRWGINWLITDFSSARLIDLKLISICGTQRELNKGRGVDIRY